MNLTANHEELHAEIDVTDTGVNTLALATAGKRITITAYLLSAKTACVLKFQRKPSGGAVDLTGQGLSLAANGHIEGQHNPAGHLKTEQGDALLLTSSATALVGGHYTYILDK